MRAASLRTWLFGLCLATAATAASAAEGHLTPPQQKRIKELVSTAEKLRRGHEPVRAYLYLREAYRLEQLWSSNTFDESSPSKAELERYTTELVRGKDGALMEILHSPQVALNDKLNLLRVLEQEIIMNYPGKRRPDEMLSPFEE